MKQKQFYIFFFLSFLVFACIISPSVVNAQQGTGSMLPCPPGQTPDASGKCQLSNPAPGQLVDIPTFGALLTQIIQILLLFAGGIAVVFLVIGGFQYVTARGNEEAMEKAKKTITNAIIGLIIIVLAYSIVTIVNNLLVRPPTFSGQG